MRTTALTRSVAAAVLVAGGWLLPATHAEAAEKCVISGASRTCYALKDISKTTRLIEVVTVQNSASSKKPVTASCEFEKSFSRSATFSVSSGTTVGASAEMTLMGMVKAAAKIEFNITVGATFSQSASSATKATSSTTLDPGERLTCTRKNTQVTTTFLRTIETGTTRRTSTVYVKGAPRQLVVVEAKVSDI